MLYAAAKTTYSYDKAGNKTREAQAGALTGFVYDGENRLKKMTNPDGTVFTCTYTGNGQRRTYQKPGQPVRTMSWDGSDYLGEI